LYVGGPLATGGRPSLELTAAAADGEVGDEGAGVLTGAVRYEQRVSALAAGRYCFQRPGDVRIWFTFISVALPMPRRIAPAMIFGLVTRLSSPTS